MHVVIIGGGYAGIACATRLARRTRQQRLDIQVTLINERPEFVERIRLHQLTAGQPLKTRPLLPLLARAGVTGKVGRVDHMDLQTQTLMVEGQSLRWDRLVLAMGSAIGRPPRALSDHVHILHSEQGETLTARLSSLPENAVVSVIGGGLTGIETATEIAGRFPSLNVQLLTRGHIGQGWSAQARDHLLAHLHGAGIRLHEDLEVKGAADGLLQTTLGTLPSTFTLWTAGFSFPALATRSGLATTPQGQVLLDPMLRALGHPNVYVAGDMGTPLIDPGQPLPTGCKTALPMGAHVADNLLREASDRPLRGFDYALTFYCLSLGRRDGLIQWPDADGHPKGHILTGRRAAWLKELICRYTWWSLQLESFGLRGVMWDRTGRAPQALPDADLETVAR